MRDPGVATGDGALGFWAALREVFPETKEQRCWVHKSANVLDALPKSIQPLARKMLGEIRDAEDRDHARDAAKTFDNEFRAKWPKAAAKIRDDLDVLLTFYDFPAEHWIHLKTSNPIESSLESDIVSLLLVLRAVGYRVSATSSSLERRVRAQGRKTSRSGQVFAL